MPYRLKHFSYGTGLLKTKRLLYKIALIAGCALCSHSYAQQPAERQQAAGFTETGADGCLMCHSLDRMTLILQTPHADTDNPHTPWAQHGCESCHGPGSLHVRRLRRGKERLPMIEFGADADTPVAQQTQTCLEGCHAESMGELEGMEWVGSVHATENVSCSDCHQVHSTRDRVEDKGEQAQACYACHEKVETDHSRFESKAIHIEKLSCWTCHDVHQLIPQHEAQAEN